MPTILTFHIPTLEKLVTGLDKESKIYALEYYLYFITGIYLRQTDLQNMSFRTLFTMPEKFSEFFNLRELASSFIGCIEKYSITIKLLLLWQKLKYTLSSENPHPSLYQHPTLQALCAVYPNPTELCEAIPLLAKHHLSKASLALLDETLTCIPAITHSHLFQELFITPTTELKIFSFCERWKKGNSELKEVPLTPPPSLTQLLQQAKKSYLQNGRCPLFLNQRYVEFCDDPKATLPALITLIVQQTGRLGHLHADSFFCLLLLAAEQQKNLTLFNDYLPKGVTPIILTGKSKPGWLYLLRCNRHRYQDAAYTQRKLLLSTLQEKCVDGLRPSV